jgi:hypothetical protein
VDLGNGLFIQPNPWLWPTGSKSLLFTSINDCINHCNASSRTCQILGQTDVFGFWQDTTVPFKSYNETFGVTIGPNQVNQTGPLLIQGEAGIEILGCCNWLDNPLGILTTVQGITFRQLPGCSCSTWYQAASNNSQHLTWNANLFDGNMQPETQINGTFDSPIYFSNNFLYNNSYNWSAVFTARNCSNHSFVSVSGNTWDNTTGSSLEVIQWASLYVVRNVFLNVGGSYPYRVVNVNACYNSTDSYTVDWNEIYGQNVDCSTGPIFPTGYYLDPVQYQIKSYFSVKENLADGFLCYGMELWNYEPFECAYPDPQFYIRLMVLPELNYKVIGAVRWIVIVPQDAAAQAFIEADPDNTTNVLCFWCNNGCPGANKHVLVWVILILFFVFFVFYALICMFCPGLCICCDCPNYDSHEDPYLKQEVYDDHNLWPQPQGDAMLFNDFGGRAQLRPTAHNPGMVAHQKQHPGSGGTPYGRTALPIPYE